MTRICILDNNNTPLAYMDNDADGALHYGDDTLKRYLEGSAASFEFTAPTDHPDAQHLKLGNSLAFRYRDRDYYLTIAITEQDDESIYGLAYGLSTELINEITGPYSGTSMKFQAYFDAFAIDVNDVTVNINEVSGSSLSLSWDGTETVLARLFSLATRFDAELEFVPHLNDDYSLKGIDLNVYHKHTDTNQGVGRKRVEVLKVGVDLDGVSRRLDMTSLCTAIRPIGKDGLNLGQVVRDVYDDDGNLEYYTHLNQAEIYAPLQRDKFPSNVLEGGGRYSLYLWNTDYTTTEQLWGNGLAKLKEISVPQAVYEISGYADVDVGDTITIADQTFEPPLYLTARVTEQSICLTDETKNKNVYSNVTEEYGEISDALVRRMYQMKQEAIAAAKETELVFGFTADYMSVRTPQPLPIGSLTQAQGETLLAYAQSQDSYKDTYFGISYSLPSGREQVITYESTRLYVDEQGLVRIDDMNGNTLVSVISPEYIVPNHDWNVITAGIINARLPEVQVHLDFHATAKYKLDIVDGNGE